MPRRHRQLPALHTTHAATAKDFVVDIVNDRCVAKLMEQLISNRHRETEVAASIGKASLLILGHPVLIMRPVR